MDYRDLTKEDIEQYKKEINQFMSYRNILFWCAIGSFSGAVTFLAVAFYIRQFHYQFYTWSMWLVYFSIAAGIACFIFRTALFTHRINSRRVFVEKAEKYQERNQ